MKQFFTIRPLVSGVLLVSALALLSGCDWFSSKDSCPGCHTEGTYGAEQAGTGEVLLSLRNKPVITVSSYEDYWQDLLKSDPNLANMLPFMPNARQEVFKNAKMEKIIQEWAHSSGIEKDAEFKSKRDKQRALADRMVALQAFQDAILKTVDTEDAALEKFYADNKETNTVFQQPPFVKTAKGIKIQSVQFSDEKSAKDFLAKVQKPNANFVALAKAAKKDAKDLGVVSGTSKNVDFAVRAKAKDMKSGEVALVSGPNKLFSVLKAGKEEAGSYAPFAEVKDSVKQAKLQVEFGDKFSARIAELEKEYGAVENQEFFNKEKEKQQADLQEKIKAMQAGDKEPAAEVASQAAA